MDELTREKVRDYIGTGLRSLEQEDEEEAQGDLVWSRQAQRDLDELRTRCSSREMEQLRDVLGELEKFPKMAANAGDMLLDLEGVRCYGSGRILIFYRYSANYQMVMIIRLALDQPEWSELIRDGKVSHS